MKKKIRSLFDKKNMALLLVALCTALFYVALQNFDSVRGFLGKLFGYLSPFIIGLVVAYLLNPAVSFFKNKCFKKLKRRKTANTLSVTVTIILLVAILALLVSVIIPEVYQSVVMLFDNIGNYLNAFEGFLESLNEKIPIIDIDVEKLMGGWDGLSEKLSSWLQENIDNIIKTGVDVGGKLINFVLGFIIAIYILLDKEQILAYISRLLKIMLKPATYNNFFDKASHINKVLIKYMTSEIIDSLIVLVSNYVFMLIFDMPYALLISVIVGVTNLIPNFGPFIGGIPSVLLILIINPMDAVIFGIWTIGLQFIDGNFIRPMLLGDSLGLSPVVVLVSIAVGGNMFGIPGMVLAAPFMSVVMYILEEYLGKKEKMSQANAEEAGSNNGGQQPADNESAQDN